MSAKRPFSKPALQGLPVAFLLAMGAQADGALLPSYDALRFERGVYSPLLISLQERLAAEGVDDELANSKFAQWFNFPNFPNFFNCFGGMWRRC